MTVMVLKMFTCPYEKVPWYNHGATMVYHGKQWYTMVWCNNTIVQITCTMVDYGIPWYVLTVPWAHPCAIMVQRTCTMVHYDIPWYILAQPQYNLLVTWHAMEYNLRTSSYYHSTNFLHHGMLWFTMVQPL